jgi:sterol desaturase/sphingolipid hydroxylase (fatty acid hydroxylase superfamily)
MGTRALETKSTYQAKGVIAFLIGRNNPRAPYLFYVPIALGLAAWALSRGAFPARTVAGLLGLGALTWTAIEYGLHRFAFHSTREYSWLRPISSGLHQLHHQSPDDEDFVTSPLIFSFPVYLLVLSVLRLASGSWIVTALLGIGVLSGYLFYEWVHYSTHHRPARTALGRYLKRYHMYHHFKHPDRLFGVTTPLWDYVFGTRI